VAQGTPEEIAASTASHTGRFLREVLARRPAGKAVKDAAKDSGKDAGKDAAKAKAGAASGRRSNAAGRQAAE
jgi:excinuclease ABC subunit A